MFRLRLFGSPVVESPDGPLGGRLAQRRQLALLALLALAERRSAMRDRLLALLWPELPAGPARHNLSDSLYVIRRALGEGAVESSGDTLRLGASLEVDVAAFEQALADGDAERAASLYAGPLLDGFHIGGAPDFERWLDGERQRLAQAYRNALEGLARDAGVGPTREGQTARPVGHPN